MVETAMLLYRVILLLFLMFWPSRRPPRRVPAAFVHLVSGPVRSWSREPDQIRVVRHRGRIAFFRKPDLNASADHRTLFDQRRRYVVMLLLLLLLLLKLLLLVELLLLLVKLLLLLMLLNQ
jgi:hypothetical protein